jgi:hypothetical protein
MTKHLLTMHTGKSRTFLFFAAVLLFVFASTAYATAQQWNQLAPIGGPPAARVNVAGVFDAATHQMIVFGGGGVSSSPPNSGVLFADTWSLTLGAVPQWRQLMPSGSTPQARQGSSAVYDSTNSRMIIFGGGFGMTSPCSNDTWVLSNANSVSGTPAWTQLLPSGSAPSPRIFHTAVYDPGSNRMIIFGGTNCFGGSISDGFSDVWVLSNANGLGGAPTWSELTTAGAAPVRAYLGSSYDPASNRMTIFGGWDPTGVGYNQVWVLSNANGLGGVPTWTQLTPSGTPPTPRSAFVAASDPAANEMIIFGGGDASGDVNETWILSGANGLGSSTWTRLNPSGTLPGARDGAVGAYDPSLNEVVIYGGQLSPAETLHYNDTWALHPAIPSLTVTSSATKVTTLQPLIVTVTVSGSTGEPVPTGSVRLTGGGYSSPANILSGGSATIDIPAGALGVGTDALLATYTPDVSSGLIYAGASGTISVAVTAPPPAAAPTFTPGSGIFGEALFVTLATATPNASVYYTTNGTVPTVSSIKYTGPIPFSATGTIRAITTASGYTNSGVSSATYTLVGSPEVFTGLASSTSTSSATLNATVHDYAAAGQVWFLWGPSTALTSSTPITTLPASGTALSVSAALTGLQSKTTYYFRPVAVTVGGTTYGAIQKFTTN